MSVVVIEGADGVGKTTLAANLTQRFDAVYRHSGPPGDDAMTYYLSRATSSNRVICDRLHLGSQVYRPVFHEPPDVTEEQHRTIEAVLNRLGCLLILVVADSEIVASRRQNRVDAHPELSMYETRPTQVERAFVEEFERSTITNKLIVDTSVAVHPLDDDHVDVVADAIAVTLGWRPLGEVEG